MCGLMFATLLILVVAFHGSPYIIESNPRFVDSWVHGETAKAIVENGHLELERFGYQAYPSSFVFLSTLSLITGIELLSLLRILPTILVLLFFSMLVIFFNDLFKSWELAIISGFVYGLSTYGLFFHFSPAIFGWLFLFLLLAYLVKKIQANVFSKSTFVILLLLILGITVTHPVTQFFTFLIMFILLILGKKICERHYITLTLVILLTILFTAWAIFFGSLYFDRIITSFRNAFERVVLESTSSIVAQPLQEKLPAEIVGISMYRRFLYVFIPFTALLGGFLLRKQNGAKLTFLNGLLITSLMVIPLIIFGILPLERSIQLAFIPLSAFSAYLIYQKKKVGALILISLLFTLPINFASLYWNEASIMTHDWEISSAQFVSANFHGTVLGEFKETSILKFYGNFNKVYSDYYLVGSRPDVFNLTFIKEQNIELVYITQLTIMKQSLVGRPLEISTFVNSTLFNCVNSNGYSITFLKNR
jgi:hypothetical protein